MISNETDREAVMTSVKFLLATCLLALSGCASTSFAPPEVSLSRRVAEQSVAEGCVRTPEGSQTIQQNVDGALMLIDNFISSYRCTMRVAANGRQAFQLPAFFGLIGSATAMAFGEGQDWGIAGGAINSVFTAGNSYYAPAEHAEILRDALEALTCIQMEAVGLSAFSRMPRAAAAVADANVSAAEAGVAGAAARIESAERAVAAADAEAQEATGDVATADQALNAADGPASAAASSRRDEARQRAAQAQELADGARANLGDARTDYARAQQALAEAQAEAAVSAIEITPERQYFNMVSSALLGVEVAAAQRLSRRGTFDPEGVRARIADLAAEAEKNRQNAPEDPPPGGAGQAMAFGGDRTDLAIARVRWVQLQLEVLRPKLQQCILRAQV